MTGGPPPRWMQRYEHFDRAIVLLREAIARDDLDQLGREGLIQRFEYSFELAWKTLKDYLADQKITLDRLTPSDVIRAAFAARIIDDGQAWMDMLDARNKMSHVYDFKAFDRVIAELRARYHAALEAFHDMLLNERVEGLGDGSA